MNEYDFKPVTALRLRSDLYVEVGEIVSFVLTDGTERYGTLQFFNEDVLTILSDDNEEITYAYSQIEMIWK